MFSGKRAGALYLAVPIFLCGLWSTPVQALTDVPANSASENPVSVELERALSTRVLPGTITALDFSALKDFYSKRNYQPAWCDATGVHVEARRWLAILAQADQLSPAAATSHLQDIQHLLNAAAPRECALLDLLLSDSFLRHVRFAVRTHAVPAEMPEAWQFLRPVIEPVQVLEGALQSGQFAEAIAGLEPRHAAYQRLRDQLARYLEIYAQGGWPAFAAAGERLEPGDQSAEIPVLRELLTVTGDLPDRAPAGLQYDAVLEQGVRGFQQRHGLSVDGIIGKSTRAALAVPVEQRIAQLRINLERWRWLPRDFGARYITVNSAAFELQVHEGDRVPLSMRVIVGSRERETPVFAEMMSYLVVNPYWKIPDKIATEDLIPALLRDRDYFTRKGIRVLSGWTEDAVELDVNEVAWQDYLGERYLPYQLRQDPGPRNSLGRIKFMLPNPYSIYLHDTPSRDLFNRPERAFSSGCIRVEDPLALATYVLGADEEAREILDALLASGATRTVSLPQPIPVFLLYHTAWVDEAGRVHFSKDIYRRDQRLLAALPAMEYPPRVPESVKISTDSEQVRLAEQRH